MSHPNPPAALLAKLSQAEARIAELESEVTALRAEPGKFQTPALPSPFSLLESITDAFIALDNQFRYVWVNTEAQRLLGMSREQLSGQGIWDLFPASLGTTLELECRRALSAQVAAEFENHYLPWDRWYWNKVYPTKDGGLAIYWRDITEQKRAQAELRRQALVLKQVHDSIISTDLAGTITDWNHAAEQITGYAAEEVLGQNIALHYFEEDRAEVGSRVLEPLQRLGQLGLELRNRHKSGREFYLRLSLSLLRDEAGEPYGMIGVAQDITDRKLAERALRESEERYRCLSEAMPLIAYTTSRDGKTQFVNQHWQTYSGVAPDQCLEFDWLNWIHPEDAPDVMTRWLECVGSGEVFQAEYRVRSVKDEYRWHLSRAVPIRDATGLVTQWVGTLTDIHDRRLAEDALRQSEERFRLAVRAFDGLVYDWDLRTDSVYRSGDLQALIGIPTDEAEPDRLWWRTRIHPDDLEEFNLAVACMRACGRNTFELEYRVKHQNGDWVHVCDHGFAILDQGSIPVRVVGSRYDITARKRLESEIQEKANRLTFHAAVLATTTDAIIAVDQQERITYCNPATERLYRVRASEVVGLPLSALFTYRWLSPDDEQRSRAELASKGAWSGENIHLLKSGEEMIVSSAVSVLRPELGGGMVAVIRDISDRKRAELELAERATQLARANDDLMHFAYAVSHDLQTPLRTISSFSQLLALNYKGRLDEEADEFIRWIVDAAARMTTMLRDLLRFARAAGDPVEAGGETPLEAALATALSNLRSALEESGAVITHDPLPAVVADAGQMAALFQNLIGNSLKYRKPGLPPAINLTSVRSGADWLISVSDNGIGFDPRFAGQIFGVFQRLHRDEFAGTGIGLAICKKIVERFGGHIWASSTPGEGAIFSFTIPAERQHAVSNPAVEKWESGPAASEADRHFDELFQLLDMAQAMVKRFDDGTISVWTQSAAKLFGWSKQEAIGQYAHALLKTEFTTSLQEIEATLFREGTWTGELKKHRKDGSAVWLASQWFLHRDGSGRPQSVVEVFNDITDLKNAEQALLRSSQQRNLALRAGRMGIWYWDQATGVVEWEETIELMLGMKPGSFGRTFEAFLERVHPDDRIAVQARIAAAMTTGPEFAVEFRMQDSDGHYCWLRGQGKVLMDGVTAKGLIGVVWDMTERKAEDDRMRETAERLALGIHVSGLALAEVNYLNGTIQLTAEAARCFGLGHEATTVTREQVHATFHPEDRQELQRRIAECLDPRGPGQFEMEHRVVTPDGETRWLSVRKQVYFEGAGQDRRPVRAMLGALDITHRKLRP